MYVCVCVSSSVCKRLGMLHQVSILVVLVVGNTEKGEGYIRRKREQLAQLKPQMNNCKFEDFLRLFVPIEMLQL